MRLGPGDGFGVTLLQEGMVDSNTAGFKGWKEVRFFEGKNPDGSMRGTEGFRSIMDGRECRPEQGWDGEPPCPTGDQACARHVSEAYRRGYDQIRWGS